MKNITPSRLVSLSRSPRFNLGYYEIVSQNPRAIPEQYRYATVNTFLPMFMAIWYMVEKVTGHRWKCTSYIRASPSHRRGQAFDLAPDIDPDDEDKYAVSHNSDPVLYKRAPLIRQLQQLTPIDFSLTGTWKVGIFIEPDHLHVQILRSDDPTQDTPTAIVKWKIPKIAYSDTYERMELPMLE